MKPDFSGWATRAGVKCSDGRTIMRDAFKHNDGGTVPLVWQHGHSDPSNILGKVTLENRNEGVYVKGYFNDSEGARNAKEAVIHGDIKSLSIYANRLKEDQKNVTHGTIREVSLVLSGANPEARIDNVYIQHGDGEEEVVDGAAIIHSGDSVETENKDDSSEEKTSEDKTIQDVLDSMSDDQLAATEYLVAKAYEETPDDSDDSEENNSDKKEVSHMNVFDNNDDINENGTQQKAGESVLSHSEIKDIFEDAKNNTGSLMTSVIAHAESKGYGVDNLEFLFPEARALTDKPEFISRQMDWVNTVLSGARKVPFSRIKTVYADITADEARAKGYITGNLKKEEFFGLAKRETHPTTIYKKQKLDRDDIIDVTTMDIVAWLWAEMRIMLNEEIARAVLFGDGRSIDDEDKIDERKIRPVATDHEFFTHKIYVPSDISTKDLVKELVRAKKHYKGSGNLTMYCSEDMVTEMLLAEDQLGRVLYPTEQALATALRVSKIVTTDILDPDLMDPTSRIAGLRAILVNMNDYTIGTDKGGEISQFDDFDIDYNQYKYLLEGRMSGALTKRKSAIAIWNTGSFTEDGENIEPSDFSQQLDERSNHPQFRPSNNKTDGTPEAPETP